MNRQGIPEVQKHVYLRYTKLFVKGFTDLPTPKFSKLMTKSELNNDQSKTGVNVPTPHKPSLQLVLKISL